MLRLLLLATLLASPVSVAREPLTLLPLGDSITAGGAPTSCYREFLAPVLEKKGIRFVGPTRDKFSAHAGFGGRNSAFLRERIEDLYRAHPADIVLIHAGHNHFAAKQPVPGIIDDTEAIIRTIHRLHPEAVILLAQVIPSGKLPKYSYIPALNRQLEVLARRLDDDPGRVILVDQADGFDWKTDTLADRVHPNPAGAKKMGDKWLQALRPLL